ncbi:restriction endonuclease subunit S [Vibrio cholerae]|uniref:restriction endonuclease subunit S n=1 Tax=Vibrio cholerae TaxID=666 RepID=UPI001157C4A3|nr:restriction endonuclease subunit S [Vibrio cholerae]TQP40912.1 restriction endonuclease subunit S [Vibrio cholerae]
MSAEKLITDHIDIWTSAVKAKSSSGRGSSKKRELYGIMKLRELILELAVYGKLTSETSFQGRSKEIILKAADEKRALAKERKIRADKEVYQSLARSDFPSDWEIVCIGQIAHVLGGKRVPKGCKLLEQPTDFVYLRVTDMKNRTIDESDLRYISEDVFKQISRYTIHTEDVYVTIAGTIGAVGSIPPHLDGMSLTENAAKLVFRGISKEYIIVVLQSDFVKKQFNDAVNQMAQPKLSLNSIKHTLIPIPSIEEQHRIVAKVDELMALCDQLEQQTEASLDAHQVLVETLLATLTNSQDATELMANWARISEHFDTLFTTEQSIDTLKQTILQLAVMGKLVAQDPNDEPAAKLLERIAEEKAQLVKEKKIKKQKALPPISEDEKPFELPNGWEWCRFGTLVNFKAELVRPEEHLDLDQVAPDSIEKGTGKLIKRRTVAESGVKGPNSRFYAGQILYSKIRPSLSKAIIAEFDGLCSADMYPLEAMVNSEFLLKIILSEVFLTQVRAAENRIKMPKLNVDSLSNILVPICPDNEMGRISSKLSELMFVSDQLKQRINKIQQTQLQMTDAIVELAL